MSKIKEKNYKVLDKKNYLYGVFPYNPKGKEKAQRYADKLNKQINQVNHDTDTKHYKVVVSS